MSTMTLDITALCNAIDAGDDVAIAVLADALEEAGDPLATGLRLATVYHPDDSDAYWGYQWWDNAGTGHGAAEVTPDIMDRLKESVQYPNGVGTGPGWCDRFAYYGTRSAAYLALAEAMLTDDPNPRSE